MKYLGSMLAAALVAGLVQFSAADDCCQRCGCQCACRPVTCRIVCDKKIEKYYCYVCECEDFCLPGPGRKTPACCDCCAAGVEKPCDIRCDCCMARFCEKHCMDFIFKPRYCQLYHRRVLKKYECQKEVPVYKCVVVELCPGCCAEVSSCGDGHAVEGIEVPPDGKAPKADEKPLPPKVPSAARRGLLDIFKSRSR